MNNKNYNVILTNNSDASEAVTTQLAKLFKISTEKAKKILQQNEFVIKKQTDKATAEKFHKTINAAGINCRIEEIIEEDESALPTIENIQPPAEVKPLIDPAAPDITPLESTQRDLSLESKPVAKNASPDNKKVIDDIKPENFCPECGTIRASVDSSCIHCGYDPLAIKKSSAKRIVIKVLAACTVLAVAAFLAMPFYQQYAKRLQIENDLQLAFDTRNAVTQFIQKTNFWPNQNIDAGLPKLISNQSIESIIISDNAVITVTLRKEALEALTPTEKNQTLIFTPNTLKGRLVWNCLKGTLAEDFRPDICRKHTVTE